MDFLRINYINSIVDCKTSRVSHFIFVHKEFKITAMFCSSVAKIRHKLSWNSVNWFKSLDGGSKGDWNSNGCFFHLLFKGRKLRLKLSQDMIMNSCNCGIQSSKCRHWWSVRSERSRLPSPLCMQSISWCNVCGRCWACCPLVRVQIVTSLKMNFQEQGSLPDEDRIPLRDV